MKNIFIALSTANCILTTGAALSQDIQSQLLTEYSCNSTEPLLTPAKLFKDKSPSVALIKTNKSIGTGFVIKHGNDTTWVLTNSHVLRDSNNLHGTTYQLKWHNGLQTYGSTIYDANGNGNSQDLAIIAIEGIHGKPLKIRHTPPVIGEEVLAIGSPLGLELSLTRGIVSQVRRKGELVQFDAATNPGNSGGPLFDSQGCVIGVVTFILKKSEGLNFALGYKTIRDTLFKTTSLLEETCRPGKCQAPKAPPLVEMQPLPPQLPPLP